ncbi:MAG: redoxin domain-containing protein [Anaerolineae bacterium]|nr:redoxin domain-containing protein [Anaerolineae bacterium]
MQGSYPQFTALGVEVVALAVAPRASVRSVQSTVRAEYPMLADRNHQVAEAYGVYNLLGDELAAPSVFVVDGSGYIVWSYVGTEPQDRPAVADILAQLP